MTRAITSLPVRTDAPPAGDLSSCGFTDSLSSSFANGGIGLGHPGLVARKRSLDNLENIPPPGPDRSTPATGSGIDKSTVSLLDLAAQQLSQNQHKRRRAVITASSPGGQHRMTSNPRRVAQLSDNSFLRSISSIAHRDQAICSKAQQPRAPGSVALFSTQSQHILRPHLTPQPQASTANNNCTNTLHHSISGSGATSAASARLRRLPKRNLKPLDFSGLHQPSARHSATAKSSTAADATGKCTASSRTGTHSSGMPAIDANILSLPVSPAQSSPLAILPVDGLRLPTSSPSIPLSRSASVASEANGSVHPTPPNTEPRRQSAFSGLLASAYQRASTKRSSKRALCFESISKVEDESLQECDAVLGPRCPVIGVPGGLFETQKSGIDTLRREQNQRGASMFSEMTRTVHQAQRAFETAVTEQSTRGRPRGRQPKATPPISGGKSRGQSATNGKGAASKRPISECKYCGKQYKYHAKLASHEQHCSSRLEALLYSADEHEQHIIHCVCGPRHDRPVGERDDLPMVQCDNCLLWLHIECVGIDEDNLPEEFFCPRCEDAFDHRRGGSGNDNPVAPSTPKRRNAPSTATHIMSPESSRLATLLAGVPDADADTDTDDEPMIYKTKAKSGGASQRRRLPTGAADEHYSDLGSEDTMSISMSEAAQFHRRGGSVKGYKSPILPRMAQSEAGVSPVHTASHHSRRVRTGVDATNQVVLTDAPSSDFLGLPLPETIFSEKPGLAPSALVGGGSMSIQQQTMDDLTHLLSTSQPQWSLAQLSDMLGGATPGGGGMIGGGNGSYLDLALADLGLGLGTHGSNVGPVSGTAAGGLGNNDGPGAAGFDATAAPLSELVDFPIDNEFSALLESIASGNAGTDADPYSSLGVDGSYGSLLSDDILLELNSCMPISGPLGAPSTVGGGRLIGSRLNGGEVEIGSSSTITLMHDTSSLCSQDNIRPSAARMPRALPPPPVRPPPGMPGMSRGRSAGTSARSFSRGASSGQMMPSIQAAAAPKTLGVPMLSNAMPLSMSSNPPSTTGLGELDVRQLLLSVGSSQVLDWPAEGDALEMELEGLINFDA